MTVYTDSDAKRRLEDLLDEAKRNGRVRIRREDGQEFDVQPVAQSASPFDVRGAGLDLTADEIVSAVREVRSR